MQSVRREGTDPELRFADLARSLNRPFLQHPQELPGRPDFIFPELDIVVFIHGCFWHGHERCKKGLILSKTEPSYWKAKVERNKRRDRRVSRELRRAGYRVYVIWECQLKRGMLPTRIQRLLARTL